MWISACVDDMSSIGGNTGLLNNVSFFCSFGSLFDNGDVVGTVWGCGAASGFINPTNGAVPVLKAGNLGSRPGVKPFRGVLK